MFPSRNEKFLQRTVADVLEKARGDIEVIVCADGYWPNPPLPDDPRLVVLHRGKAQGMRPGINAMCDIASGPYLMKMDAHCMVAEGFDVTLQENIQDNWIVTLRRYALDPEAWKIDTSNSKYPVDYHYLAFPWERPDDPDCGLHGTPWTARREARKDILFDDEMSSQGSCWFMTKTHWRRLGDMEIKNYGNFVHEFQELGMKTWLGGGEVKVNKHTWYAHLYKGQRYGRGYSLGPNGHKEGVKWCVNHWMFDRWAERQRDLRWLVERFWPIPGWPTDWEAEIAKRRSLLTT